MKCKECGNKVPISKPLLIITVIEGVIILFLIVVIFILGLSLVGGDTPSSQVTSGKEAMIALAENENSSPYYTRCEWCPNYGYITKAELTDWKILDGEAYYTYKLSNDDLTKYMSELENALFNKNPFSNDKLIVYTRDFGDSVQNITISPNRENEKIVIYAKQEQK